METVRWGILGAAKFALEHMGPAIHAARGAKLSALATSSAEKAAPFQAFCPDLTVYKDYDALLADPEIDAVYIPLPNAMHVDWTLKAAKAGKHVLCEKPIAMKADEIDALIGARDETGLLMAEAYMIVHHPQWLRVRELLGEGAVGELLHINALFSFRNTDLNNIRNQPDTGGGIIPDIGVYTIGSARFATGLEPHDIRSRITYENGVDVKAEFNAQFGGASYFAMVSMRNALYQEVLFHGSDGYIKVKTPFNAGVYSMAEIEYRDASGVVKNERWPSVNQYVVQVENFGKSVREGADYPWSLENAKGTQAVIDAVYAADKGN